MSRSLFTLFASSALIALPVLAQEDYTRFKSEAVVQTLGSFVKSTTEDGVKQSSTNSGGVLATYR